MPHNSFFANRFDLQPSHGSGVGDNSETGHQIERDTQLSGNGSVLLRLGRLDMLAGRSLAALESSSIATDSCVRDVCMWVLQPWLTNEASLRTLNVIFIKHWAQAPVL